METTKHTSIALADTIDGAEVSHSAFWVEETGQVHYVRRGDNGPVEQTAEAATMDAARAWLTDVVGVQLR